MRTSFTYDVDELGVVAEEAARAAASVLRPDVIVSRRKSGHHDIVTEQDVAAEQLIREVLTSRTPEAGIVGEEGTRVVGDAGSITWFIDPIDGTSNFAAGLPLYCVSVGAAMDGLPAAGAIYDPVRDELFSTSALGVLVDGKLHAGTAPEAESDGVLMTNMPYEDSWFRQEDMGNVVALLCTFRAVRRLGSSALALAYVATGRACASVELRTQPWDHAAGAALVLAAGGQFRAMDERGAVTDRVDTAHSYIAAAPGFDLERSMLLRFGVG